MAWHDVTGRLTDPTPSEFAKWIQPQEPVQGLLAGMTQQLSDTLFRRLCRGRLYAAAASASWDDGDGHHSRGITAIDPSWWVHQSVIRSHDSLWLHGDITLLATEPNATAGYPVDFFGVKFEFSGWREVFDPLRKKIPFTPLGDLELGAMKSRDHPSSAAKGPTIDPPRIEVNERVEDDFLRRTAPELFQSPVAPAHRPRANPVTDHEIKAWFRQLTKVQKTLGVPDLWDLARKHHEGRHLPRKMVEQFGKGRGNGHRAQG